MKFKRRNLEVTIDGQTLTDLMLDFEDMVLYQQIHGQHRFELALVAGMEDDSSLKEEDFIGKIVNVQMGSQALSGNPVPFVAIIANVKSYKEHATRKHVYLSGFTPDYLMNVNRYTRAFTDMALADIVALIAGEYDASLIDIQCDPTFTEVIPYIVQYKETDYEFIKRLSQRYGEWFYYDGDNFVFGKRIITDPIVMELRKNLMHVEYDLDLVPPPNHMQMYNYHEEEVFKNHAPNYPTSSFAPAQGAHGASDQLFGSQLKKKYHSLSPFYTDTQAGLDNYVDVIAGKRANDLANIKGSSDTFGPTICSVIDWTDKNLKTTESKGKFVILQATHSINSVGEYRVEFTAAPDGNDYPPVDGSIRMPQIGTEIAKVTQNADKEKNARIKVQFQWMETDQETPWIRIASTAAGHDRGFYWIPEVDDEVVVAFENMNPDRPYMLATMFKSNSQTQIPAESTEENDIKMIKTRSGHTMIWNDTEGEESITLIDKNNNQVVLDTPNKTVTIYAPSTLNLISTDINIQAGNKLTMLAKPFTGADGEECSGDGIIEMQSKLNTNISSEEDVIDIKAQTDVLVEAVSAEVGIKGATAVNVESIDVALTGTASVKAEAAQVEVKGSGTAKLEGGGMTEIKGGLVKIN